MGIKIITNRAHVTNEVTEQDIFEMEKVVDLKYIQIGNYICENSLRILDEYILRRNRDIQFRIFRFDNSICNLQFLKHIKNVKNLSIDTIQTVEGLEYLSELKEIESLAINIFDLDNIEFLKHVNLDLKKLSLGTENSKNKIDLLILNRFLNLEALFLYKIKDDLVKLLEVKKLKKLTLNGINLPDLQFIKNSNIVDLAIGYTNNCNLDYLKGNSNINTLELSRIKKINDVDIIKEIPSLEYIKLNQLNNIEEIPDIRNNQYLQHIILDNMKKLNNISELEFVPNLKYIEMYQLKLIEIEQIECLLRNKNIIKLNCSTGIAKKDKIIKQLINEKRGD
jgi:hypothetical protein